MAVLAKKKGDSYLVTNAILAYMLGYTTATVTRLVKNEGMPSSGERGFYDIKDCFRWYFDREIETRFAKLSVEDLDDEELSEAQVDIALKKARTKNLIEDTEIKTLKKEILDGVYVKADELDRNMAELAVIFISALKDIRATMPRILANRSEAEVRNILDEEFEQCIDKVNKGIYAEDDSESDV